MIFGIVLRFKEIRLSPKIRYFLIGILSQTLENLATVCQPSSSATKQFDSRRQMVVIFKPQQIL